MQECAPSGSVRHPFQHLHPPEACGSPCPDTLLLCSHVKRAVPAMVLPPSSAYIFNRASCTFTLRHATLPDRRAPSAAQWHPAIVSKSVTRRKHNVYLVFTAYFSFAEADSNHALLSSCIQSLNQSFLNVAYLLRNQCFYTVFCSSVVDTMQHVQVQLAYSKVRCAVRSEVALTHVVLFLIG